MSSGAVAAVAAVTVQEATGKDAQSLRQTVAQAQTNLAGITGGRREEGRMSELVLERGYHRNMTYPDLWANLVNNP